MRPNSIFSNAVAFLCAITTASAYQVNNRVIHVRASAYDEDQGGPRVRIIGSLQITDQLKTDTFGDAGWKLSEFSQYSFGAITEMYADGLDVTSISHEEGIYILQTTVADGTGFPPQIGVQFYDTSLKGPDDVKKRAEQTFGKSVDAGGMGFIVDFAENNDAFDYDHSYDVTPYEGYSKQPDGGSLISAGPCKVYSPLSLFFGLPGPPEPDTYVFRDSPCRYTA